MSCSTNRGALTRLAIAGQEFRFLSWKNSINNPSMIDLTQETIRGTFDPHSQDVIDGQRILRFQITLQPTPLEMGVLLPYLGFTNSSGSTWIPKVALDSMSFRVDVDLGCEFLTYASCTVSKWVLSAQRGRTPWTLQMDIVAKTEASLTPWATNTAIGTGSPYAFHQSTLSLSATNRSYYRVVIANDFHLEDEFYNSQTATDLCPQTWDMTVATAVPWTSANEALYTGARDSSTRPAGIVSFASTGIQSTFTFPELVALPKPPDILRRDESLKLGLFYKPVTDASNNPFLTITHDSTV